MEKPATGIGYLEYKKYLNNDDIFVFYWDREKLKTKKHRTSFLHASFCEL